MRTIKFRMWDKENKVMCCDVKIDNLTTINRYIEACQEFYEFMLYTGLKDKHGKEIYEGDVAKYLRDEVEFTDVILYKDASYQLDNFGSFNKLYANKYIEVIGNIYENPDLLK